MTASPSASAPEAVAVSVPFVVGEAGASDTVAVGGEFCTVTAADVDGADESVPSLATTRTSIPSFLSPLPACDRSSVAPVAPGMSLPFLRHW